ncbi:signal transduction histidine kinase [Clostridium sp. CAG:632]|jgi:signal transduction histidine kinase|nr:HAMP domain-containing histidine kinase [Clostridium sp.]CCY57795.1 signal transduction histidine kinase [Clostridium sp. CAG:632]
MKLFANKEIKRFFLTLSVILTGLLVLSEGVLWFGYQVLSVWIPVLIILAGVAIWIAALGYFRRQNRLLEDAVTQIHLYLDGNVDARIECNEEGELYTLFHSVNSMAAILNAHAANELREKEFLKDTISDISHQLKTPLAALNIYNGLLQDETESLSEVKEFAALSEQELDRIEMLVQSLLKITRLDAGAIVFEKTEENVAEMMKDVELHFAYRAGMEQKQIVLSGADDITMVCDRDWMIEAMDNLVKNALDHTKTGDTVHVEWQTGSSALQIRVRDNGCGIHPEDLYHIFKRFYRSRFSKDQQGIGLGLPLAKAIIEAHSGTIEVDSELNVGTTFTINFLNPTKL